MSESDYMGPGFPMDYGEDYRLRYAKASSKRQGAGFLSGVGSSYLSNVVFGQLGSWVVSAFSGIWVFLEKASGVFRFLGEHLRSVVRFMPSLAATGAFGMGVSPVVLPAAFAPTPSTFSVPVSIVERDVGGNQMFRIYATWGVARMAASFVRLFAVLQEIGDAVSQECLDATVLGGESETPVPFRERSSPQPAVPFGSMTRRFVYLGPEALDTNPRKRRDGSVVHVSLYNTAGTR
jgi:hypothetical protein